MNSITPNPDFLSAPCFKKKEKRNLSNIYLESEKGLINNHKLNLNCQQF